MLLIFALIFVSCESLSIGVNKNGRRDVQSVLNPEWAQLKSKQDNELREFVEVKAKPKKRLAPPVNFVLRAVAEPEGDDYYDKGQGDSDNEDYYERKEWSDLHRPVQTVDRNNPLNPSNLSDIDGIIHIITKPIDSPVTKVSTGRNKIPKKNKVKNKDKRKRENDDDNSYENVSDDDKEKEEIKSNNEKPHRYEDDVDYEEGLSEKQKSDADTAKEEEQRENEAKKAKILESVDELKERHAQEQHRISENAKEEEIHKEEIERDRIKLRHDNDKYGHIGTKWKKVSTDYSDEYDDPESELKDKYKINHWKTATGAPTKETPKKIKSIATGKLSVFRNPHLYMVSEEEDDIPNTTANNIKKPTKSTAKSKMFSSKYSVSPKEDDERISLIPDDESKEGEPTLFFPKVKNRRKLRIKTTTAPDLHTSEEKSSTLATGPVGASASSTNTEPEDADSSATQTLGSTAHTAPTASDTAPSATDLDLTPSPSDEKKKKEEIKNDNYDFEAGKDKKHHSEHDEIHEEHGKKAYEGVHKEVKTSKGHRDKEDHLDKYDDHGGIDKRHHDEKKHYGSHKHEEHGKKHAKYEESGKHSKGHSTKGSHDIHKKDEYEKKVEFFEEEGDSFDDEADGGHHSEKEHSSGGHYKKGSRQAGYAGRSKGETGHFGKGSHGHFTKGHGKSAGHDSHAGHGAAHHKSGGGDGGKKWIFHHGFPAKTANLVLIDRRADAYQHGPQYFG